MTKIKPKCSETIFKSKADKPTVFLLICFAFLMQSYEWAQNRTRMRNLLRVSLVAQLVKNLPTMRETWV